MVCYTKDQMIVIINVITLLTLKIALYFVVNNGSENVGKNTFRGSLL